MLDLGASNNVMRAYIYEFLDLSPLKETGVVIEFTNHTNAFSKGVLEDVLVWVNGLNFLMDF